MDQHVKEMTLIGIVLALTLVVYLVIRRAGGAPMQNAERVLTGLLGAFMVLGGTAKFFNPFTTMFAKQIETSQLPLPELSAFAGQAGEIASGLVLLAFFVFGSRFTGVWSDRIFYLTSLLITVIMCVAIYVHLHPNVPAEVLPFQSKPPVLTIVVMLLAWLNAYLHHKNQPVDP